jgi:hypothetical protein
MLMGPGNGGVPMGIGFRFGSMSKLTIHLCYDSYLNFIMTLRIVQIENPTVRTGPLNHFRSDEHRNSPFPMLTYLRVDCTTIHCPSISLPAYKNKKRNDNNNNIGPMQPMHFSVEHMHKIVDIF